MCNKFYNNEVAIVGSGDLISQNSGVSGKDAGNNFNFYSSGGNKLAPSLNSNADVFWVVNTTSPGRTYFYETGFSPDASLGTAIDINGTSYSGTPPSGFSLSVSTTAAACYAGSWKKDPSGIENKSVS